MELELTYRQKVTLVILLFVAAGLTAGYIYLYKPVAKQWDDISKDRQTKEETLTAKKQVFENMPPKDKVDQLEAEIESWMPVYNRRKQKFEQRWRTPENDPFPGIRWFKEYESVRNEIANRAKAANVVIPAGIVNLPNQIPPDDQVQLLNIQLQNTNELYKVLLKTTTKIRQINTFSVMAPIPETDFKFVEILPFQVSFISDMNAAIEFVDLLMNQSSQYYNIRNLQIEQFGGGQNLKKFSFLIVTVRITEEKLGAAIMAAPAAGAQGGGPMAMRRMLMMRGGGGPPGGPPGAAPGAAAAPPAQ